MKQTKSVRRIPQRTCVSCRMVGDKKELIRLVRQSDGVVVVDEVGRLPGRGAYLCRHIECWQDISRLERALKVQISPETKDGLLARGRGMVTDGQGE